MKNINEGLGLKFDKQAVGLAQQLFTKPFTVPVYGEYKGTRSMAAGGPVVEPGPSTIAEDTVPARLNPREYVIPEEVVMRKGTDFFDNLVDKSRKGGKGLPKPSPVMKVAHAADGGLMDRARLAEEEAARQSSQLRNQVSSRLAEQALNPADDISAATKAAPFTSSAPASAPASAPSQLGLKARLAATQPATTNITPRIIPEEAGTVVGRGLPGGSSSFVGPAANERDIRAATSTINPSAVASIAAPAAAFNPDLQDRLAVAQQRVNEIAARSPGDSWLAGKKLPGRATSADVGPMSTLGLTPSYTPEEQAARGRAIAVGNVAAANEATRARETNEAKGIYLPNPLGTSPTVLKDTGKADTNIYGPGGENLGPTGGRGLPKPEAAATEAQTQKDYFDRINEAQLALDRERLAMLRANTPAGSITPEQVVALLGSNRGEALADTYQSDAYRAANAGTGSGDVRNMLALQNMKYNMDKDLRGRFSNVVNSWQDSILGKMDAKGKRGSKLITDPFFGDAGDEDKVRSGIQLAAAAGNDDPTIASNYYDLMTKNGGYWDADKKVMVTPVFDENDKVSSYRELAFPQWWKELYPHYGTGEE